LRRLSRLRWRACTHTHTHTHTQWHPYLEHDYNQVCANFHDDTKDIETVQHYSSTSS
jgi:hypothetical protein